MCSWCSKLFWTATLFRIWPLVLPRSRLDVRYCPAFLYPTRYCSPTHPFLLWLLWGKRRWPSWTASTLPSQILKDWIWSSPGCGADESWRLGPRQKLVGGAGTGCQNAMAVRQKRGATFQRLGSCQFSSAVWFFFYRGGRNPWFLSSCCQFKTTGFSRWFWS